MYDQTAMSNQLQKSLLQKQIITLVPSALYYPFAEQTGPSLPRWNTFLVLGIRSLSYRSN